MKKVLNNKKIISIIIIIIIFVGLIISVTCLYNRTNVCTGKDTSNKSNALKKLDFPTAYNTSEITHTSLINFPNRWHGYKYWLAATPYPKGDSSKENPHIFVSNNLIDWSIPKGLTNPLDEIDTKKTPNNYNSDTHLIYNEKKKHLELFWRYVDKINNTITIYYITSKNGIDWTDKQVSYYGVFKKSDMLSPAIIKEKDIYMLWYVDDDFKINYRESKDLKIWSNPTIVNISFENSKLASWHIDIAKNDGKYEMLISAFERKSLRRNYKDRKNMSLYYSSSFDNINWTKAKVMIKPSNNKTRWDGRSLYRSSFIKENNYYLVLYSGISCDGHRGAGLAYGKSLGDLSGLRKNDASELKDILK